MQNIKYRDYQRKVFFFYRVVVLLSVSLSISSLRKISPQIVLIFWKVIEFLGMILSLRHFLDNAVPDDALFAKS